VALALALASSASAAFPGANGALAVQPRTGGGIVLVSPTGRGAHRICAHDTRCGKPRRPQWSPDGRALVFAGPAIRIVYADGSCLNCQFGRAPNPSFTPGGTVISFIARGFVTFDKIDGNREAARSRPAANDAVWSKSGALAVVRGRTIWAGRPGHLRRIAQGVQPSWAPDATKLAAVQRGWIVVIRWRDHHVRRLVRGSAPAFSPDGRWIAYVAPDHHLMIVRAAGARVVPRRVGNIRAVSVDWQPRPRRSPTPCTAPPGSTVIASSPAAVVTGDGLPLNLDFANGPPVAYMGCLRADGRERLLERFTTENVDAASFVSRAVLAAPYAGLELTDEDAHYMEYSYTFQVFDLRTGRLNGKLGGQHVACGGGEPCGLDEPVLGSDGVSAAHVRVVYPVGALSSIVGSVSCAPGSSTCVATDSANHVLGSTDPTGGAGAWNVASFGSSPYAPTFVDCPSTSLCVGGGGAIYTTTNPTGGAADWTTRSLPGGITDTGRVTCATTHLCVVAEDHGDIRASTNPTGGKSAWPVSNIDDNRPLNEIFCSTRPQCFVDDTFGNVFTSEDPAGGASTWKISKTTPIFFAGACPTPSLCVAVNGHDVYATTDPAAGGWTKTTVGDFLNDVACPSSSLCVAVGDGGALDTSREPAAGVWSHTTIDNARVLGSISCASPSLCVATDWNGHVVTSTNPTGGPSAWITALVDGDPCAETTPCSVEEIDASDAHGLHAVDTSHISGNGPFLTGLRLAGDVLSWSHDRSPRSVTLARP
jgi:hypothetical protein